MGSGPPHEVIAHHMRLAAMNPTHCPRCGEKLEYVPPDYSGECEPPRGAYLDCPECEFSVRYEDDYDPYQEYIDLLKGDDR